MIDDITATKIAHLIPSVKITYTYDIGVGFLLITSEGAYEEIGYNYNEWPLYRFKKPDALDTKRILSDIESGKFSLQSLDNTVVPLKDMITEYNASVDDASRAIDIYGLIDNLKAIMTDSGDVFYAFMTFMPENHNIQFFKNYDEMVDDFVSRYELTPWTDLYQADPDWVESVLEDVGNKGFAFHDYFQSPT